MAVSSTWFMMTPELLLEYRTDRYKIIQGGKSSDKQPSVYYIYKGKDGRIAYAEDFRYTDITSRDWYKNQSVWQKFPDSSGATYRWMKSLPSIREQVDWERSDLVEYTTTVVNTEAESYPEGLGPHAELSVNMFYDSINVYFLRGYNMDDLDGITLRVKSFASCQERVEESVYKSDTEVTLLDAFIDKTMLSPDNTSGRVSPIHLLASPLFMNSRFYDKYITIEFPSPYAIGLRDRGVISDDEQKENDPTFLMLYFNEDGTQDVTRSDIYTLDIDSNITLEFA